MGLVNIQCSVVTMKAQGVHLVECNLSTSSLIRTKIRPRKEIFQSTSARFSLSMTCHFVKYQYQVSTQAECFVKLDIFELSKLIDFFFILK